MTRFFGAVVTIALLCAWTGRPARASIDLDRQYALETVGALRSWDNVDGLFADYVSSAYQDYFSHQSRFVYQDLSKASTVLESSKIPYVKLIADPEVLAQVARVSRSQSLIRTKIAKEGRQYRVTIEWLHAPQMDVMASDSYTLQEPMDGQGLGVNEMKASLEQSLDRAIHQVPFLGAVTGRDGNQVTMNIGSRAGVTVGDTLIVSTLDEVKKHPLLHTIVEWRLVNTGKVVVDQVDDRLSFGHVVEEEPDKHIERQQKIVEIRHAAPKAPVVIDEKQEQKDAILEPPKVGWVMGGIQFGGFDRTYGTLDNSINKSGSGFLLGAKADSQIWLTHEWFSELGFNLGFWNYNQNGVSVGASNLFGVKIAGGYSYLLNGDLLGPKGWIKLGYKSDSFSLPSSASDATASISFKTFFVGLGADLPIRDQYGALLDLRFGLFNGASEDNNFSGDVNSVSDVGFQVGGYYRYAPRLTFRVTLDFDSYSADFKGATAPSISQKVFTFVPAVLYYF